MRITFPIGPSQPMLDICSTLAFTQRAQMISGRDPLPQLVEPWAAECRAELRLTEQKALQCHRSPNNDIRQHSQLFERLKGQVLRFVDDQQHALAVAVLSGDELADALQQRSLGEPFLGDTEAGGDHMEKII